MQVEGGEQGTAIAMDEPSVNAEDVSAAEVECKPVECELSDHPNDVEINEIAKKLLKWKFLLSALEVHIELCERGREQPLLRDFFSNPGNFETSTRYDGISMGGIRKSASNLTLDSIDDFARYSDDGGREVDEKVAVLEFELRRAKETIKELRENITEYAQENEASLNEGKSKESISTEQKGPVKPFELRALNYLTNEFLLNNDYRLTAVTFGEEVGDQDIDDWDDVGVNTARPPDLLHLFRDYGKHVVEPQEKDKDEIKQLKDQIWQLEMNIKDYEHKVEELQAENGVLRETIKDYESSVATTVLNPGDRKDLQNVLPIEQNVEDVPAAIKIEITNDDEQKVCVHEHEALVEDTECQMDEDKCENLESRKNSNSVIIEDQLESTQQSGDVISIESNLSKDGTDSTNEKEEIIEQKVEVNSSSKRQTSASFIQVLFGLVQGKSDTRLMKEVLRAAEEEDAIDLVTRCLPNVVPNVLLNKREELIPIILCLVRLHPDIKARDNLLHMLFNLIKRPDDEQRKVIIDGCVAFAKKVGSTRIEAELLPQCWEQITHKYPERRLLVAETCGSMAPYIPPELLSSLMFSMLRQMLEDDRNEHVREAATKSLALILAFVDDTGKYTQAFDLFMKTLMDENEDVSRAGREMLLPVIGVWSLELGNFQSLLLAPFLKTVEEILKNASTRMTANHEDDKSQALAACDMQFKLFFQCCIDLVPLLFAFVLQSGPFDSPDCDDLSDIKGHHLPAQQNILTNCDVVLGDDRKLGVLVYYFDRHIENPNASSWPELDWVCDSCVSQVTELTGLQRTAEFDIMEQLVCFLCKLCRIFGRGYTYKKIIPYFEKLMRASELPFLEEDQPPICSPLLPLFICGVLSVFTEGEDRRRLCTFLKQSLVTISTQNLTLENLELTFRLLSANSELQADLIQVLREALVHPSTGVRISTAPLLEILVRSVTSSSLFSQVASALITLSNDSEFVVKVATVSALGSVVETRTDKNLLEKICLQLQSLMDDPGLKDNTGLQKTLLRTFARIMPNAEPKFRENFLVQRIRKMVEQNSFIQDLSTQMEMARELCQTISSLLCCYVPSELISSQIMPALRYLERDSREYATDVHDTVKSLIIDAENRIASDNTSEGSGSSLTGKEDMKNKLLSGFHRLKDASTKKRDLFKKKERSSTLL